MLSLGHLAENRNGVSDFDRLRAAVGRLGSHDAFLYAFDLLELDGQDLRREPWETRRATLASLLRKVTSWIKVKNPSAPAARRAIDGVTS